MTIPLNELINQFEEFYDCEFNFDYDQKFFHQKNWGYKYSIQRTGSFEITYNIVAQDGYCSIHSHDYKLNRFFWILGDLDIRLYNDINTVWKELVLNDSNRSVLVTPGLLHDFYANKPSLFIEVDFVARYDVDDIKRLTEGGIDNG